MTVSMMENHEKPRAWQLGNISWDEPVRCVMAELDAAPDSCHFSPNLYQAVVCGQSAVSSALFVARLISVTHTIAAISLSTSHASLSAVIKLAILKITMACIDIPEAHGAPWCADASALFLIPGSGQ
jgi:hypothetical protein